MPPQSRPQVQSRQEFNPWTAAADTADELLFQRIAARRMAEDEARKRAQTDFENYIKEGDFGIRQSDAGVRRGELGLKGREFEAGAPQRTANVANTQSITHERDTRLGFDVDKDAETKRIMGELSLMPAVPGRMAPGQAARAQHFMGVNFLTPAGQEVTSTPEVRGAQAGTAKAAEFETAKPALEGEARIRGDEQIRVNANKPKAASADTGDLDNLAAMAVRNPDVLKDLDIKTRTAVVKAIANSPQGSEFASKRDAMTDKMLKEALSEIDQIEKHPGFSAAVGWNGPIGMFFDKGFSGSDRAGFESHYDALKAKIALPNLQLMRGMGALSDREGTRIESASSPLKLTMQEGEFRKTLGQLRQAITETLASRGGGATTPTTQAAPQPSNRIRVTGKGPNMRIEGQ